MLGRGCGELGEKREVLGKERGYGGSWGGFELCRCTGRGLWDTRGAKRVET